MKMFNQNSTRIIATFLMIAMLFSSCRLYHIKSRSVLHKNAETIVKKKVYPQILLHSGDTYWQIKNPAFKDNVVSGELTSVNEKVDYLYRKALTKGNFQISAVDKFYANQLHLYVDAFELNDKKAVVNLNDIKEIKILDENKGLTNLLNIGITSASIIGGFYIFLLIVCGCPHNYTYDGEKYHYNNTLFTGATAPNLERNDYKSLPDYHPENSIYKMLIKNEEDESQFTNVLEMIVVNHQKNIEVMLDQQGNIHTVLKREKAIKVNDDLGNNLSNKINDADDDSYAFDQIGKDDFSHVYATFNVSEAKENAKIIIRSKNSTWGGLVYHSFAEMMGKNHAKWVNNNLKRTPKEAQEDIIKAGIPLIVEVKKNGNWMPLEAINLISEINYNEVAISVPKENLGDSTVEFRITSGYKFWELDAVHMDFSSPQHVEIQKLKPTSAIGNEDFTNSLLLDDKNYMQHKNTGDSALISFENLPISFESRSLFLHSKGYYISKKRYEGPTNWQAMFALKQKGGFSLFSKELYEAYKNMTLFELENK
jgi:hypothetical protein